MERPGAGDSACSGGCGVVYQLTPTDTGKWKYTVLHKFTGQDGFYPGGGVILDRKGNLYGTALQRDLRDHAIAAFTYLIGVRGFVLADVIDKAGRVTLVLC